MEDEEENRNERLLSSSDKLFLDTILYSTCDKNMISKICHKQKEFDDLYVYTEYQKPGIFERLKKKKSTLKPTNILFLLFPIFQWLPKYKWHTDIFNDIVSGITVAILHIPQGLAYSILAGVPPIVGIYMAFFPVIIYAMMGTSRHISTGTFAVICMMAGKSVSAHATILSDNTMSKNLTTVNEINNVTIYSPIEVVAALSFVVGMWQVLLGFLRLGSLCVILSEHLISGLVTGAAILVIVSQMKHIFGLKLYKHIGALKVIYTLIDLVNDFSHINYVAVLITGCVFTMLMLYSTILKDHISKRIPFPIPTELLVIISGTLISKYLDLPSNYNIVPVGKIPVGFPPISFPRARLYPKLILDGLVIGIVSFSVNISMASIFAEKHHYRIEANQELVASGCANIFGSFFSCAPFSASLSRSLVQDMAGGRTQLASIVSCILLSIVLLCIGPFFEPLPNCVLAGIILAAMKGMIMNVKDLFVAWKQSKLDGCIWLVTFLSVVLIDIDIGLCIGVIFSLLYITLLGQKVKVIALGNIPNTDIYVHIDNYQAAVHVPGVLILHIVGGMNFANKESARRSIYKKLNKYKDLKVTHVILDMTSVCYIDQSSVKCLLKIYDDMNVRNITLNISKCSLRVLKVLIKCDFFSCFPEVQLYPSVHDAVISTRLSWRKLHDGNDMKV